MKYIEKLTPEMSGKKVTCRIRNRYIEDALLIKDSSSWFILNNEEDGGGFEYKNKYGYWCSYHICSTNVNDTHFYPDLQLQLKNNKIYELWT